MLHLPLTPGFRPLLLALLVLASTGRLLSQAAVDGSTIHEKSGIALIKPQAWSKEGEATVFEFQGYIDRASGGAGYYEFRTKLDKRQVPVSRIVKIIIYPDPAQFTEVITQADRQKLVTTTAEAIATAVVDALAGSLQASRHDESNPRVR